MDKRLLNGFEKEEEKGKIKRSITIDWDLDYELKKLNINVSELINQFLWYYIKRDNKGHEAVKQNKGV